MARLARLALPGHTHYVLQRAAAGRSAFAEEDARRHYLAGLAEHAPAHGVQCWAYALLDGEAHLLLQPQTASGLSRLMQTLARVHARRLNRNQGCSTPLWAGRFGAAVIEPGPWRLRALLCIDQLGSGADPAAAGAGVAHRSSAGERSGATAQRWTQDPPEVWALGNTPFEREHAWRGLLAEENALRHVPALRQAALGGWVLGSAAFVQALAAPAARPLQARARGRPPNRTA